MKTECMQCNGFGKLFFLKGKVDCDMCEGTGIMSGENILWKLQGEIIQEWRIEKGLTLRKAAKKYRVDPSNLSKMERGIIRPKKYYTN